MGEQTVKKHKFKKWRKPGKRMQVMLGFVLFKAVNVTPLRGFQGSLPPKFFKPPNGNEGRPAGDRLAAMLDGRASARAFF